MTSTTQDQSARERHKTAIQYRDELAKSLADHCKGLTRAISLVEKLSAELQRLEAARDHRTSQMATCLATQFQQGAVDDVSQPTSIESSEQLAVKAHLEIVEKARDQLELEVTEKQRAFDKAKNEVRENAIEIIRNEAEQIADTIDWHHAELRKLRANLYSLSTASYMLGQDDEAGRWQRPKLLSHRVILSLQPPAEPQYPPGHDPAKLYASHWKSFFNELMHNANATYACHEETK